MLFTQCRGCGEVFVVQVDHLILARGRVRCNLCGTVFDALETLSAEKPYEDEDLLLHEHVHAPPLLTKSFLRQEEAYQVEAESEIESGTETDSEAETDTEWDSLAESEEVRVDSHDVIDDYWSLDDDDEDDNEPPPAFMGSDDKTYKADLPYSEERGSKKSGRAVWGLLSVLLLLALLWQGQQALAAGRLQLPATNWAENLCDYAGCAGRDQPLDLENVSLVSRNIRSHPGRDNALIISASMIKTQSDDKRFPALQISLSDLNGQVIAMRRFLAAEYLPGEIVNTGFVNNTLVPITLEIKNPGEQAVAFEIGFSQP